MDDFATLDRTLIWHPFTPLTGADDPIMVTRGEGVYLYTNDGRKIIDAVSSWWVNLHGHSHPDIAHAIADQALKLEHVIFAGFTHEPAIRLAENLLTIIPKNQSRVFFSDNGSTAVEVALKMAFQYWYNSGVPKKKVIAINGAYHGDTFGAMSVGERGIFTDPFNPFLFETIFIDFPTADAEQHIYEQFANLVAQGDVAAFIYEPLVQAAGGMRMYAASVLNKLLQVAKDHEVVCIADEVFTGFGRTGKMFASDHMSVKPDIMALSKGITGGFMPLGITTCAQRIVDVFKTNNFLKTFFHGHSYTGNPLACAAANASFKLLVEENCQRNIRRIQFQHETFANEMLLHPAIVEVRVLGTIIALELHTTEDTSYANEMRKKIYPYFLNRNILLRPLGNILYILPPYIITNEELEEIYQSIREFLSAHVLETT